MFKIFKKKEEDNVEGVNLSLREIKELAELAGFEISKVPDNYEEIKDDCESMINVYQDNVEGFVFDNEDGGIDLYRVVCVYNADTELNDVFALGENLFEK